MYKFSRHLIQNLAARVITCTKSSDHIKFVLIQHHRLPVHFCIQYKTFSSFAKPSTIWHHLHFCPCLTSTGLRSARTSTPQYQTWSCLQLLNSQTLELHLTTQKTTFYILLYLGTKCRCQTAIPKQNQAFNWINKARTISADGGKVVITVRLKSLKSMHFPLWSVQKNYCSLC